MGQIVFLDLMHGLPLSEVEARKEQVRKEDIVREGSEAKVEEEGSGGDVGLREG